MTLSPVELALRSWTLTPHFPQGCAIRLRMMYEGDTSMVMVHTGGTVADFDALNAEGLDVRLQFSSGESFGDYFRSASVDLAYIAYGCPRVEDVVNDERFDEAVLLVAIDKSVTERVRGIVVEAMKVRGTADEKQFFYDRLVPEIRRIHGWCTRLTVYSRTYGARQLRH